MPVTKEDREKLRERLKALDDDERTALAEELGIKPTASIADLLKTVETLQAEVAELKKAKVAPKRVSLAEKLGFGA